MVPGLAKGICLHRLAAFFAHVFFIKLPRAACESFVDGRSLLVHVSIGQVLPPPARLRHAANRSAAMPIDGDTRVRLGKMAAISQSTGMRRNWAQAVPIPDVSIVSAIPSS